MTATSFREGTDQGLLCRPMKLTKIGMNWRRHTTISVPSGRSPFLTLLEGFVDEAAPSVGVAEGARDDGAREAERDLSRLTGGAREAA